MKKKTSETLAKKIDVMDLLWKYVITEGNLEKAFEYLKDLVFKYKPTTSKGNTKNMTLSIFEDETKTVEVYYTKDSISTITISYKNS